MTKKKDTKSPEFAGNRAKTPEFARKAKANSPEFGRYRAKSAEFARFRAKIYTSSGTVSLKHHLISLKNVIKETLKSYKRVLYIDSSIQILNGNIGNQIAKLKKTSMLTQMISLKLNCYTNPLMYKWFGETNETYKEFRTIEANILLFERSFLSMLLMKAWVTCALDKSCISPPGSKLLPCCGCHRYDQDAITVVNSFFYTFPKQYIMLPAFVLSHSEKSFYLIKRYEKKSYFTPKPSSFLFKI